MINDENAVASTRKSSRRGGRSRPALAAKPIEDATNEPKPQHTTAKPAAATTPSSSTILRSWEKPHDFFIQDLAEPLLRCEHAPCVWRRLQRRTALAWNLTKSPPPPPTYPPPLSSARKGMVDAVQADPASPAAWRALLEHVAAHCEIGHKESAALLMSLRSFAEEHPGFKQFGALNDAARIVRCSLRSASVYWCAGHVRTHP